MLNDAGHNYGQTCDVEHIELYTENEMRSMNDRYHLKRHKKTQVNFPLTQRGKAAKEGWGWVKLEK